MHADPRVVFIGEDVLDPYGGAFKVSKGLSTAFPGRVLTTPISEAAIVGVGIGMAVRGMRPIVEIMFGDFLTLCADQIVNHATKFPWMYNESVTVPLVIRAPMGGYRGYGPTHSQSLESLFMNVPLLTIVAPSHFHDPGMLLGNAVMLGTPVLFVENKLLYPSTLFQGSKTAEEMSYIVDSLSVPDASFPTLSVKLVNDTTPDVVIVTYGGTVSLAVDAAMSLFLKDEICVEIIIPSQLKPVPVGELLGSARQCGRVVLLEEGSVTSGWTATVASMLYEHLFHELKTPIARIGAHDYPIPSAKHLEEIALPSVRDVEQAVFRMLG